jgi:hypothetical protein
VVLLVRIVFLFAKDQNQYRQCIFVLKTSFLFVKNVYEVL